MNDGERVRFPVHGMTCGSCVNRITRALRRIDGVSRVTVDLRNETATVTRVPRLVPDRTLSMAIADAGYLADLGAAVLVPAESDRGFLGRLFGR